jgi:glycerol-3-phosphate acyltransferase PlsY
VLRSTKLSVALLSLAADLLKGLLAAWIGLTWGGPGLAAACGAVVVVGHCYSPFISFKGGKGVATAAGVIAILMPQIFLVLLAVMVLSVALTRYVSLGSVLAAALFPILCLIWLKPWPYIILSFFLATLVLFRHQTNIKRLMSGQNPALLTKRFSVHYLMGRLGWKSLYTGSGSWGTAQALVLHHNGFNTTIWGKPDEVALITADRENRRYLPGLPLPEEITITSNLAEAMEDTRMVVLAVPSQAVREVLQLLRPLYQPQNHFGQYRQGYRNYVWNEVKPGCC